MGNLGSQCIRCATCGLAKEQDVGEMLQRDQQLLTTGCPCWNPECASRRPWPCSACTLENAAEFSQCTVCDAPRGGGGSLAVGLSYHNHDNLDEVVAKIRRFAGFREPIECVRPGSLEVVMKSG
jgi:hypothetical protein